MSAEQHRSEAEGHERAADASHAKYDPDAVMAHGNDPPRSELNEFEFPESVYNPTEKHLEDAEEHREHAKAHRAAAEALESFEAKACKGFPPATRWSCPLIGQVSAAENITGGVRLRFESGVHMEATVAHIRCHMAYAATRGFKGMRSCPMYIAGVTVKHKAGSTTVDLVASDPSNVPELRKRAARHVSP